jgi:hypothetical protein
VKEEEDDAGKWDYVMLFRTNPPPKDKDGNTLPESDKRMKNYKDLKKKRKDIVTTLNDPKFGLTVKKYVIDLMYNC